MVADRCRPAAYRIGQLAAVVGQHGLDHGALAAVGERQLVVEDVQVQPADVFALDHRLQHERAAGLLGHLVFMPLWPSTAQSIRSRQRAASVSPCVAEVDHRDDDLRAARAQAADLVAGRRDRIARVDAGASNAAASSGVGGAIDPEHADLHARGVDDPSASNSRLPSLP